MKKQGLNPEEAIDVDEGSDGNPFISFAMALPDGNDVMFALSRGDRYCEIDCLNMLQQFIEPQWLTWYDICGIHGLIASHFEVEGQHYGVVTMTIRPLNQLDLMADLVEFSNRVQNALNDYRAATATQTGNGLHLADQTDTPE